MARKSTPTTPFPNQAATSVTLTQQAVNALRQMVNAIGWAKTIEDITYGGQLLSAALPELDPVDWVKTAEEQQKLTAAERKAYIEKDAAWGGKPTTFPLSAPQQAAAVKAFRFWVDEAGKNGRLAPATWLTELISVLGVDASEDSSDAS